MKIAVVENENFFFPRGWRGISCFITSTTLDLDPQETGREGKKNGTKGYMLLWIVGRDPSLSLSFSSPLSFFHYSRNVHLFAGLVDVAFSFQRLYAPTMGRRTESFDSVPVADSFFSSLFHERIPLHIDREKFRS